MQLKTWLAALLVIAATLSALPEFRHAVDLVPLPQARQDLISTAEQVASVHPAFVDSADGAARQRSYLRYAEGLAAGLREPLTYSGLLADEDRVLNYVKDPHTLLAQNWSPLADPELLPVGFFWAKGGLVVYRVRGTPAGIETGDRVLAIGGIPTALVLVRMRRFFSGNVPWLHTLAGYYLPLGNTLTWLGVVSHGDVALRLERPSGQRYRIAAALVPLSLASYDAYELGRGSFLERFIAPPGLAARLRNSIYAWQVTPDYGIFWLTACQDSPGFERAVQAFFQAVRRAGVSNVVIDLQENMGGDAAVAFAFLAHMPLKSGNGLGISPAPGGVFPGHVYVLVNGATMSSGVEAAEFLTEEGDGILVGSPAGLASGAWGEVQGYQTPDGSMNYQVSTMFIDAVNHRITPALMPSIELPLTAQDVARGVNPVTKWLARLPSPVSPCT